MHATYETVTERPTLTFERTLRHPIDAVWDAITDPEELPHWFPSTIIGELAPQADLRFEFPGHPEIEPMRGRVTEFDRPRTLAFTWGGDELRFELAEAAHGTTTLRFTVALDTKDKAARDAAGWHVCLDRLERSLVDKDTEAPGGAPTGEWRDHYEEYQRRGLPADAPIPS